MNKRIIVEILKIGIPTIIGILLTNLNSIFDMIFLNSLNNKEILGIISPYQAFVSSIGYLIGHGGGLIYKDNKSFNYGNKLIRLSFIINLFISIIGIIYSFKLNNEFQIYYLIIIIASIFSVLIIIINNLLRFNKIVYRSMFILLIGLLINILFDYLLINNIGIIGNAIAYLISQFIIFILMYIIFRFKCRNDNNYEFSYLLIIKYGLSSFIYQLLTSLSIFMIIYYSKLNDSIVLFNLCNRSYMLLLGIAYGISQATMPLINKENNKSIIINSLIIIYSLLIIEIPLFIFSNNIVYYFTNLDYSRDFILFLISIYFISPTILLNINLQVNKKLFKANLLAILRSGGIFIILLLIIKNISISRLISDILVLGVGICLISKDIKNNC